MSDRKKRLTKALSMALGLLSMGGQFSSAASDDYFDDGGSTQYATNVGDYNDDTNVMSKETPTPEEEENIRKEVRERIDEDLKKADIFIKEAEDLKIAIQNTAIPGSASQTTASNYQMLSKDIVSCLNLYNDCKKKYFAFLSDLGEASNVMDLATSVDEVSRVLYQQARDKYKGCASMFDSVKASLAADAASSKKDQSEVRMSNLRSVRSMVDASLLALDTIDDKLRVNPAVSGVYTPRIGDLRASLAKIRSDYGPESARDALGVVEREYALISKKIEEIDNAIKQLTVDVENDCTSMDVRTNYDAYTDTLTTLENMWADFLARCNPARLSDDMLETTRTQAMMSFERGRSVCEEIRKQLIELSNKACEDDVGTIKKVTQDVEEQCRGFLAKLSRAFAACSKMFDKAAWSNSQRRRPLSLTEVRQQKVREFFQHCRTINSRDNLDEAQRLSNLITELNKLLPGRGELHAKLLDIISKPVEMNRQGRIEPSALQRKNVLLIGNVGTGKTEEVNRVLDAANIKSIFAKPGDFSTSDSANTFWENFLKETENSTNDVVIVFDEIESILPSRWGDQEVSPAVANFNIFMDKLASKPSLMAHYRGMIGTTNLSQERLDPALVSRIANVITVPSLSGDRLVEAVAGLTDTVTFDASSTRKDVNQTIADIMERHNISIRDFINILESEVDKQRKLNGDPAAGTPDNGLVLKKDSLYASLRGLSLTDAARGRVDAAGGRVDAAGNPVRG